MSKRTVKGGGGHQRHPFSPNVNLFDDGDRCAWS
jgi:hypothetical protein